MGACKFDIVILTREKTRAEARGLGGFGLVDWTRDGKASVVNNSLEVNSLDFHGSGILEL